MRFSRRGEAVASRSESHFPLHAMRCYAGLHFKLLSTFRPLVLFTIVYDHDLLLSSSIVDHKYNRITPYSFIVSVAYKPTDVVLL